MSLAAEITHLLARGTDISHDDLVDITAVLILLEGKATEAPAELAVLTAFADRAGIVGIPPEAVPARIAAYFEGRPSSSLVATLGQLIRADLATAGEAFRDKAAMALIGAGTARLPRDDEDRPPGTVPAGPAARFAMAQLLDDEELSRGK